MESPSHPRTTLTIVKGKAVVPFPEQMAHVEKIKEILRSPWGYGYLDTSEMGCGKTYIVAHLAQITGKKVLVTCPKTVKSVWRAVLDEYWVPFIDIIGYESLRSSVGYQPRHGLLERIDAGGPSFRPTKKLLDILQECETYGQGILLVVDEAHKNKNNSITTAATSCLTMTVSQYSPRSRFAFLTVSIYDNEENAVNIMRAMGLVTEARIGITNIATGSFTGLAVNQAIAFSWRISEEKTRTVLQQFPPMEKWRASDARKICHDLFVNVIKEAIGSAMPKLDIPHNIYDGFFMMDQRETDELNFALAQLKEAARRKDGSEGLGGGNMGLVMAAHQAVQSSKVPIFYRLTRTILRTVQGAKVVCSMKYLEPLKELLRLFREDSELEAMGAQSLLLVGEVKEEERANVVRLFNEDPNYRILVMNSDIGSLGISLHDTKGDSPRYLLVAPNFDLIGSYQLGHRVIRAGTKSTPNVFFVYCNSANEQEHHILQRLAPKGAVLRSTMEDHMKDIKLPGTYPRYMESEDGFVEDMKVANKNDGKLQTTEIQLDE